MARSNSGYFSSFTNFTSGIINWGSLVFEMLKEQPFYQPKGSYLHETLGSVGEMRSASTCPSTFR
uniref:Uncharacterized protein n=1 Tax=Salix viminalis TaxID=40686 RepID=A0A6N2NB51_SALVM